jgi:membrane-bound lytic murein transglycosylase B
MSTPELDPQHLCALLLHPEIDAEDLARAAQRRRTRVALTVAAATSMTLAPAVSLAEDTVAPDPIVSASCQITTTLVDGTPSGVLDDGSVCIQPVSVPAPADPTPPSPPPPEPPAAEAPPTPQPEPTPAPATPAQQQPDVAAVASDAPGDTGPAPSAPAPAAATATPAGTAQRATAPRRRQHASSAPVKAGARHRARTTPRKPRHEHKPAAASLAKPTLPMLGQGPATTPFFVTDEPVIPRFLVSLYKQAGRHYHVPWPILAAINEIETDFGRNVAVSSAGATGWMQFMPATWRTYGVDADHNGVKDPDNPRDAIFAAARYLKASGAAHDMRRAIFAYNHAGWYVDSILLRAERIAAHQGVRDRRLSRLFHAGQVRLERQVLADPRITLYACGREDIAAHRIDRRVLITLRFLAWSGLHPTVTSLECGHSVLTASGNVSEHSTGSAVDIAAINGIPILGNQGSGSVTEATIRELLTLRGAMAPHQIISLMTFARADNTFAMSDHADHIHVGFRPLAPLTR